MLDFATQLVSHVIILFVLIPRFQEELLPTKPLHQKRSRPRTLWLLPGCRHQCHVVLWALTALAELQTLMQLQQPKTE